MTTVSKTRLLHLCRPALSGGLSGAQGLTLMAPLGLFQVQGECADQSLHHGAQSLSLRPGVCFMVSLAGYLQTSNEPHLDRLILSPERGENTCSKTGQSSLRGSGPRGCCLLNGCPIRVPPSTSNPQTLTQTL